MVNEELEEAQRSVDKMDDEYKEAQQYIADSHGEGDPKEMFQTRMLMGQIDNRGASAVVYRDRLKKTKSSPYFARIDFAPQDEAESAAYYIGLYAFRFQQQLYVIDWRSPVASMFYDFELGPAFYDAPQGPHRGPPDLKAPVQNCKRGNRVRLRQLPEHPGRHPPAGAGPHLRREDEVHHLHHPERAE